MKIVDLNVLLYAVNRDAELHRPVLAWWHKTLGEEEPIGLCWIVLLGFLRLATNPRVFPHPLTVEQALDRVDAWLRHPNTRVVSESDEHWSVLRRLLDESGTAGNLTSDAHLAAIAVSYGAELVSCDADFTRFRTLRYQNPLDR